MNDFEERWNKLLPQGRAGGLYRVYPDHPLSFFLDYSLDGRRELLIEATGPDVSNIELPIFENIELVQTQAGDTVKIGVILNEEDLNKSFGVMCYDLAVRSEQARSAKLALLIISNTLRNWSDLLKRRTAKGLTDSEALGLFGELLIVDALLNNVGIDASTVIRGWRGPVGDARDIGLNGTRIEVKTRHSTRSVALAISSLAQLDDCGDRVYVVLNRVSPSDHGTSLNAITERIIARLRHQDGAAIEFERKLELSGYDAKALVSKRAFSVDERLVYFVGQGFPRLVPSNVPDGVIAATYEIGGAALDAHKSTWSKLVGGLHD